MTELQVLLAEVVVEVAIEVKLMEVRETLQLRYRHKAIMVDQADYQHLVPVVAVEQEL
jgi:hypothetical protein